MRGRYPSALSQRTLEKRGGSPVSRGAAITDPPPPRQLDKTAKAEWVRLCRVLAGVLTEADLGLLEAVCIAFSRWRFAEAQAAKLKSTWYSDSRGTPHLHPAVTEERRARESFAKLSAEFGLSPVSRHRVAPAAESGRDELEELLA